MTSITPSRRSWLNFRKPPTSTARKCSERRFDAWVRLLATSGPSTAACKHERMKLPAYGGNLFDPDRFAFLEGRKPGT